MEEIFKLLDEQNQNNLDCGNSEYYYGQSRVPRVTEILSKCIHSDSLMYWANSLGFKHQSYSKTIALAASIGSECHESIDLFMDNNYNHEAPDNMNNSARFAYESFLKWWNTLISFGNVIEVIYHEYKLVCKYFGGTLDGLYRINGKIYLIDYKTSNQINYKYYLQLAAYRYMLREILGIEVDGCIILQLSKVDISYNEYVLNFDNTDHLNFINECERAFLSLVYSFYNVCNIENRFKTLKEGMV